jgi:ribose 5-phosphate isomerase B
LLKIEFLKYNPNTMKIAIAADHAGFEMKEELKSWLVGEGHEIIDFGTNSLDSCDYADFVHPAVTTVEKGDTDKGLLVCGSGQGVAITANKHQGIRAALVWDVPLAALARQHNDANVICIPARFVTLDKAIECLKTFLETDFEGGRHANRVAKIAC